MEADQASARIETTRTNFERQNKFERVGTIISE